MASGLPASLVFATLSIWLREEGLSRTAIGFMGAVATPYAINFLWAPIIDRVGLGLLGRRLGKRRSWIFLCQMFLVVAVFMMAVQKPDNSLYLLGFSALLVSFLSATQDIAIDAYRIEILSEEEFGIGSAIAIYGWHTGAFITGAGALYVATFGGWMLAYLSAAIFIGVISIITLFVREPIHSAASTETADDILDWLKKAALLPVADFVTRFGWLAVVILLVIIFYKFGDAMLGRMAGVFYIDLGFTKIEIANYTKSIGVLATLTGVAVGGWVCIKIGTMQALFVGGILMMVTNFSFALLAIGAKEVGILGIVVFCDNFTGGMATTAFVAYLSSLCNKTYTATQYALLASIGNFARIQLGSLSGSFVDILDGNWALFFLGVGAMSIPALILLLLLTRSVSTIRFEVKPPK
tara:strand:+ start:2420 stop:3649 length:1230 start_codon:yes stop_codon:yes gene_type:complete